jgi:predicted TIM-barrel fold metal-dependent hydrolase
MLTPWGDLEVTDAHIHFFSPNFFLSLASQCQKTPDEMEQILGWQFPLQAEDLANSWAQELDRHGVTGAALIASVPGDEHSATAAVRLYPRRFYGYFMLNPTACDAAERVHRAVGAGLRGICLFPAMHRYSIHDDCVRPVFEIASHHPGTVVFVHCGALTVGVRKKLGLASRYDMRYSNPIDLHAVALEFPRVNFVVPHFGAGFFREALMLCDMCPNVYLDTSSSNSWMRYQPEMMDLKQVFRRALDVAGASRLLFGTDSSFFPLGWNRPVFDCQMEALEELRVSESDAAQIFGRNLRTLLER